jgi:hypothetical protein
MWIQIKTNCSSKWNPALTAGSTYDLDYDSAKQLIADGLAAEIPPVSSLAAKADDSAVVHKTGNENVAGVKTFASNPVFAVKPAVTGAKSDAVAGSILAALVALGLVTDSTT